MRLEEIYSNYDKIVQSGDLPYLKCRNCNYAFFYIRHICPKCGSKNLEVVKSSGVGKVFSWTKIFRKNETFIYGIVELEEGFRIYCNFADDVKIGDKVKIKISISDNKYHIIGSKLQI
ncbi:Zn-ribbon domain-containing OB-fold protein [Sulfolobus tengchongensis]|uniref:Zn-ribbon domain-containing OB-fold protein n=1 Tax=Sulfolobus tengchongensis TaxID=207809 RepID=A0AAX4KZP7_9CREN